MVAGPLGTPHFGKSERQAQGLPARVRCRSHHPTLEQQILGIRYDSRNRTYISTARRVISGEELK